MIVELYVDFTWLSSQKFFSWWFWYKYPSYTSELGDGPLWWLSILSKSSLSDTAREPQFGKLILDPDDALLQNINFFQPLQAIITQFSDQECQFTN